MSKHSMASGRNHSVIFEYICNSCKTRMYVPRKRGHVRAVGHEKKMYCPKCKKKRKFTQGESL